MTRPWLAHSPPGVPQDIKPGQYRWPAALLEESLRKNAQRLISVRMERWMSCTELDAHSSALGTWLQARGLGHDARVAIMPPNVPQMLVAMAAIVRTGYTVVNVNPLCTARVRGRIAHNQRWQNPAACLACTRLSAPTSMT